VDPERLRILKHTEKILVPQRGARLMNYTVSSIDSQQTWVTTAEWMQPPGCEMYGSDGSVFTAKIHWKSPNRLPKIP
jgi:hypothetical protein